MTMSNSDIVKYLEGLDQEAKTYKKRCIEMCWCMRGGLSWTEIMAMGIADLAIIQDVIKDNLEVAKKTGQPFF